MESGVLLQLYVPGVISCLRGDAVGYLWRTCLYVGVNDPIQGYTRKCLKYVCYDYDNQMVLHGYRILVMDGLTAAMKFHDKKPFKSPLPMCLKHRYGDLFLCYNEKN